MAFGDYMTLRDVFALPDQNPLATDRWSGRVDSGSANLQINNGVCVGDASPGTGRFRDVGPDSPLDAVRDFEMAATLGGGLDGILALAGRIANVGLGAPNGFEAEYNPATDQVHLFRFSGGFPDGGVGQSFGTASVILADGDRLGLLVQGTYLALYTYQGSWVKRLEGTSTAFSAGGAVGVAIEGNAGGISQFYFGQIRPNSPTLPMTGRARW